MKKYVQKMALGALTAALFIASSNTINSSAKEKMHIDKLISVSDNIYSISIENGYISSKISGINYMYKKLKKMNKSEVKKEVSKNYTVYLTTDYKMYSKMFCSITTKNLSKKDCVMQISVNNGKYTKNLKAAKVKIKNSKSNKQKLKTATVNIKWHPSKVTFSKVDISEFPSNIMPDFSK